MQLVSSWPWLGASRKCPYLSTLQPLLLFLSVPEPWEGLSQLGPTLHHDIVSAFWPAMVFSVSFNPQQQEAFLMKVGYSTNLK